MPSQCRRRRKTVSLLFARHTRSHVILSHKHAMHTTRMRVRARFLSLSHLELISRHSEPQESRLFSYLPDCYLTNIGCGRWLEEVGPSLGLQVQLLKAQNWLGNVDVTPRPHPPKKLRPATTTTTPRPNSTATCKIAEESAK